MPQPPVLQPPEWESLDAATSTPKQPDSEVMTWQQQEDLAKLAVSRFNPSDSMFVLHSPLMVSVAQDDIWPSDRFQQPSRTSEFA